jgi:hypothetical protein
MTMPTTSTGVSDATLGAADTAIDQASQASIKLTGREEDVR